MFPGYEFTLFPVMRQLQALPVYLLGAVLALLLAKMVVQAILSLLGVGYFAGAIADLVLIGVLLALATQALSGQGPLAHVMDSWVYQVTAPLMEVARALEGALPY